MDETQQRRVLLNAGLPAGLLDSWHDRRKSPIALIYGPPRQDLGDGLASVMPELSGVVAIFELNGEALIGYWPCNDQFIRLYYEDELLGAQAIVILGTGYQQFAATILLEHCDTGLIGDYPQLSVLLGFDDAPELLELLEAEPYDSEAVDAFWASLATQ